MSFRRFEAHAGVAPAAAGERAPRNSFDIAERRFTAT
jgi:hypothetical protein